MQNMIVVIAAKWADSSVTHTTWAMPDVASALERWLDGLTEEGKKELVGVQTGTGAEIDQLPEPSS